MILAALVLSAVTWQPWSDATFAAAKAANKPIFLSIGYSTCHWCHVMDRESFSDPEVSALMNDAFVCIKIDREERPDIDSAYLTVTRTLTGDAGWPNNVILTPDGKPFFATSYVPREKFKVLVPQIAAMWRDKHEQVAASAEMVTRSLQAPAVAGDALGADVLERGYKQLAARFDAQNGGFLPPPKFPSAHHLMFLLRYWQRTHDAKALNMVETTLKALRRSALYDQTGFGFHRYASDAKWADPHYEKMLYDQALMAMVDLEAYQATHKEEYAQTAREIFMYALRDLKARNGLFYSAQDADEEYYKATDRAALSAPKHDPKVITDWNGLMIAALSYGATVLDEPRYADAAKRAAGILLAKPVVHQKDQPAYLDDYAFLVWGLLNLYEATFDARYLQRAISIEDESIRKFRDDSGRFYVTAADSEKLLVRPHETGDGAMPSGSSVQLMNLVRLARITGKADYEKYANALVRASADDVSLAPSASTHFLSGLSFLLGPSYEVVLAGDDVSAMRRAVFANYIPNKIVLHRTPAITTLAPFTAQQRPIDGKATAYVCTNYACKLPVTDPEKLALK